MCRAELRCNVCLLAWHRGDRRGGDYPLVGSLAAEYANRRIRGRMMAAVVSMQALGMLAAALVALATLSGFKVIIMPNLCCLDTLSLPNSPTFKCAA